MAELARGMAARKRTPDPQKCRDKFDGEVSTASEGIVVLHSSTPPEVSGDDEVAGGYYTSGVMLGTEQWKQAVADEWWTPRRAPTPSSTHTSLAFSGHVP
jgi:hypothetical protein